MTEFCLSPSVHPCWWQECWGLFCTPLGEPRDLTLAQIERDTENPFLYAKLGIVSAMAEGLTNLLLLAIFQAVREIFDLKDGNARRISLITHENVNATIAALITYGASGRIE